MNVPWHSTGFPSGLSVFASCVCRLVRVTMVDKNKELRKLWYSLSELRSSLCKMPLERTVLRPALLRVETAVYPVFPSGMTSHSNIAKFNLLVPKFGI
jgi:hypothetical protein